jgi:prolipoprotein diacylglyceryltransferase
VPPAVISLDFDPVVHIGALAIRLETVAVAATLLIVLVTAARIVARGTPRSSTPHTAVLADAADAAPRPRLEDVLLIALAVLPGALAGGRLGYVLLHLDYYTNRSAAIIDPSQGSLELGLAVAGGIVSGACVAGLLGGSIGRWLEIAIAPTLLGLALGKLSSALGGGGQGTPSDLPWATAYVGPGPWGSLAPAIASHPAQVYEAIGTLLVLIVVLAARRLTPTVPRDGRWFMVAVGAWALVRTVVASTWRDGPTVAGLRPGQLIALGVAVACVSLVAIIVVRGRRRYRVPSTTSDSAPAGRVNPAEPMGREGEVGS